MIERRAPVLRVDGLAGNGAQRLLRQREVDRLHLEQPLASLPLAAPTYGRAADHKTEKKRRVLFFTKSSGFEHDVVKRNSAAPSLSEATLSGLGKQHGFDIVATKDGASSMVI
jgi:hypothetical protein